MTRRRRRFISWMAHLALMVLVFQMAAPDHWHPSDVTGVEGSSAHVVHCHGNASSCADSAGSLSGTMAEVALVPRPPAAVVTPTASDLTAPLPVVLSDETEPPRAL